MSRQSHVHPESRGGIFSPLRETVFRNMWFSSTISNTGGLIQSVAAAWVMAGIATADYVALVQTASFLPMALLALPAGAIADIYDRRKVQILFLSLALIASVMMMLAMLLGWITPWVLLGFCFLVGAGGALSAPARGASVPEQVPKEMIPQAIALNNISFNVARGIGPALGGMIVAAYGAATAFAVNAATFVPMLESLRRWKRVEEVSRLPPEGLPQSVRAGLRYVANMRPVRRAILRVFFFCFLGASLQALLPLIARDLLAGDAMTFGWMLGAFGIGAVSGVFILEPLRRDLRNENTVKICSLALAVCLLVLSLSRTLWLDLVFLFVAGMAWMVTTTTISVTVQLYVPRWVMGRSIATTSASTTLGIALGSWLWGVVAASYSLDFALQLSALALILSLSLGRILPVADRTSSTEADDKVMNDPEVSLPITGRSGPISIELQYRISAQEAREFYKLMRAMQRVRGRSGAYDWTLSRSIADPELWSERFRCPTWHDYLRQRQRRTIDDRALLEKVKAMHIGVEPVRVIRWLDRPAGSVRWNEAAPDYGDESLQVES